jgi:hypothetical protein
MTRFHPRAQQGECEPDLRAGTELLQAKHLAVDLILELRGAIPGSYQGPTF